MKCEKCGAMFKHTDHPNCTCDFCDKCFAIMEANFFKQVQAEKEASKKNRISIYRCME